MLVKFFDSLFDSGKKPIYECSVDTCHRITNGNSQTGDVRSRWILQQEIGDDEEKAKVNLCPIHVKEFFGLQEHDYQTIELAEKAASGQIGIGEWKRGVGLAR